MFELLVISIIHLAPLGIMVVFILGANSNFKHIEKKMNFLMDEIKRIKRSGEK